LRSGDGVIVSGQRRSVKGFIVLLNGAMRGDCFGCSEYFKNTVSACIYSRADLFIDFTFIGCEDLNLMQV
jgi:hypothetical protein